MQYLRMVHSLHALTQTYIQLILLPTSCFLMLSTMFSACSDAIIAKKQQKMMNQKKEHMRPRPGLRYVSVYMRTVRTQTGTKLTRLTRRQTGLSSLPDRSHVNATKEMYGDRYEPTAV